MRLSPRRPIGVLGLWYRSPGASRAASQEHGRPMTGHPPTFTTSPSRLMHGDLAPLEHSASSAPCVCSGSASELAHAAVLLAWPGTTPKPPNLPSHQPLVMISLRCAGQFESLTFRNSGDKSVGWCPLHDPHPQLCYGPFGPSGATLPARGRETMWRGPCLRASLPLAGRVVELSSVAR